MNKHKDSQSILDFMKNKKLVDIIEKYFGGKALGLQTEFFFMPEHKGFLLIRIIFCAR